MKTTAEIGQVLALQRKKLAIKQKDLAESAGIPGASLSRLENGRLPEFGVRKLISLLTVLGLELGADDYMTKPFGVKEIIARIRAITRRTAARSAKKSGEDEFMMDDLRIVPAELRAYRGTTDLQLSPRDLKVLRLLHEKRGKVVDRNKLADEVWGIDYFPESRALDQHISQLRKRIEKDPATPRIIRTVHGAGYRFE
jgi:DNA-binding response OmpR family regulator